MSGLIEVAEDAFEREVMQSPIPVLVDFFATWCGPCKAMAPTLEDVAREYAGEIKIVKVDIDQSPNIAKTYEIRSVPTFVLLGGGKIVERLSGVQTRSAMAQLFDNALDSSK